MNRRIGGVSGFQKQQEQRKQLQMIGQQLQRNQLESLESQLSNFQANLEHFASVHSVRIKQDARFRSHFQTLCTTIGVDPLASNKGFFTILGLGDFYYQLSIQIIEIALRTREANGGLLEMSVLMNMLSSKVTEQDVIASIHTLKPLGSGFEIIAVGNRKMIQSVARELNTDHVTVIGLAEVIDRNKAQGYVNITKVIEILGWDRDRAQLGLVLPFNQDALVKDGICWIDLQATPSNYWVSGFFCQ